MRSSNPSHAPGGVSVLFLTCDTYDARARDMAWLFLSRHFAIFTLFSVAIVFLASGSALSQTMPHPLAFSTTTLSFVLGGLLWWLQLKLLEAIAERAGFRLVLPSFFLMILPVFAFVTFGHWLSGDSADCLIAPLSCYLTFMAIALAFEFIAALFVLPRILEK